MSSGGGGGPSTSVTQTSNIPDYAKPYVMNMLGATQNQLFNTTPGVDGRPGEITGFKPYVPYSSDPRDYFAGPSSLQTGVYNEAGGMQTPGQFGQASGMAGAAGAGQLGTTSQADMYGRQGSQMGRFGLESAMPAFRAGDQYRQSVTDPSQVQSYMSPYQQAVTDVTKQAAVRDAQLAQQATNLGSARQGTYGGARQALAQAEREKNLMSNLANIQATGSQSAYDKAIQQMQYGSGLGLQGIQTGLQGVQAGMQGVGQGLAGVGAQQAGYAGLNQAAGTLGNLGTAQQQADLARMGFQNQMGRDQQQYQQNIINQQIQDFATQQQYPMMQLGLMSNMLRGLPMQSMTTQSYQAQPSFGQQAAGLLGTGASLYGAYGRKAGGTIKEYAAGGGVRASLENKINDIADAGGAKGLQALLSQTKSPGAKELIMARMREEGIAGAPTGGLGRNMAGGGIIAFGDGGGVPGFYEGELIGEDYDYSQSGYRDLAKERAEKERKLKEAFLAENAPEALAAMRKREAEAKSGMTESSFKDFDQAQALFEKERYGTKPPASPAVVPPTTTDTGKATGLDAVLEDRRRRLGIDGPGEKSEALMKALEERQAGMGKQNETDRYLRMAEAFAKFGSTAGPIGRTASEALGGFAKGEAAARKEQDKMQVEGMKIQADLEKARRAEARGDLDAAEKFYTSAEDRKNRLEAANIGAAASGSTARFEKEAIERIMKDKGVDFATALREVRGAGRADSLEMQKAKMALASIDNQILSAKKDEKPALIAERDRIYKALMSVTPTSGTLNKEQQALLDKYK